MRPMSASRHRVGAFLCWIRGFAQRIAAGSLVLPRGALALLLAGARNRRGNVRGNIRARLRVLKPMNIYKLDSSASYV